MQHVFSSVSLSSRAGDGVAASSRSLATGQCYRNSGVLAAITQAETPHSLVRAMPGGITARGIQQCGQNPHRGGCVDDVEK